MIIRTAILREMVKLVWNESSELSAEHPVFVCSVEMARCIIKALTLHSWVILHYGCAPCAVQCESHAARRTAHGAQP